jgi:hypothetical protein
MRCWYDADVLKAEAGELTEGCATVNHLLGNLAPDAPIYIGQEQDDVQFPMEDEGQP